MMNPATLDGQAITEQTRYIYSNPIWDPWGTSLLFEQFKLKGTYKPEIGLWSLDTKEPQTLTEGTMPQWLP